MASNTKPKGTPAGKASDLWINSRSNLRGPDGSRAWNNKANISPQSGARFLDLADIALGLKKPPAPSKKKKAVTASSGIHEITSKTDPYTT